jgi:hypothetical protein
MTDLSDLHHRCLEILEDIPKHRFAFRPKNDPNGSSPTLPEISETLWQMNLTHRDRIDALCKRMTLDWQVLNEDPQTWFQIEQRLRGAVYLFERMCDTLTPEETLTLSPDTPDEALEWALVRLWRFAAPLWLHHAARLFAAGMDLSSRELPPSCH